MPVLTSLPAAFFGSPCHFTLGVAVGSFDHYLVDDNFFVSRNYKKLSWNFCLRIYLLRHKRKLAGKRLQKDWGAIHVTFGQPILLFCVARVTENFLGVWFVIIFYAANKNR